MRAVVQAGVAMEAALKQGLASMAFVCHLFTDRSEIPEAHLCMLGSIIL